MKTTEVRASKLVGAKIISARIKPHDPNCDGQNVLHITTDKGTFEIEGGYAGYTGGSCDEYPETIEIRKKV